MEQQEVCLTFLVWKRTGLGAPIVFGKANTLCSYHWNSQRRVAVKSAIPAFKRLCVHAHAPTGVLTILWKYPGYLLMTDLFPVTLSFDFKEIHFYILNILCYIYVLLFNRLNLLDNKWLFNIECEYLTQQAIGIYFVQHKGARRLLLRKAFLRSFCHCLLSGRKLEQICID